MEITGKELIFEKKRITLYPGVENYLDTISVMAVALYSALASNNLIVPKYRTIRPGEISSIKAEGDIDLSFQIQLDQNNMVNILVDQNLVEQQSDCKQFIQDFCFHAMAAVYDLIPQIGMIRIMEMHPEIREYLSEMLIFAYHYPKQ